MPRPRRWHGSRCAPVPEQRDRWGLLVPVATVSSRRTAAHLSGLLADYAIRCTVVPATTAASTESTEGGAGMSWCSPRMAPPLTGCSPPCCPSADTSPLTPRGARTPVTSTIGRRKP